VRKKHIISARDQGARVRSVCPQFSAHVSGAVLTVTGELQPTGRSRSYRFRLEYEALEPPRVWIIEPALVPREEGGRIPHMYDQERLCLYLPGSGEWSGDMSLATTIIPWISDWLFYYETWHATGEWLGGGVEPVKKTEPIRNEKGNGNEGK